ncbi:MAG: hypothetical protein RLZ37_151 [Actinomycetota bacterium]
MIPSMFHGGFEFIFRQCSSDRFGEETARHCSSHHSVWCGRGSKVPSIEADFLGDDVEEHECLPDFGDLFIRQATSSDEGVGHVVRSTCATWSCTQNLDHTDAVDNAARKDHPMFIVENGEGVPTSERVVRRPVGQRVTSNRIVTQSDNRHQHTFSLFKP